MKVKKGKWLFVALALVLTVSMFAGLTGANEPEIEANYAFIPNAEEASVSKVDLVNFVEVARYSTIEPRPGDYGLDKYRVSRLAMDSGGNAWALNTMTGQNFDDYANAQGSVARINADEVPGEVLGDTTSNSSVIVENDVRVSYFDLGEPGDGPRTITIVEYGDGEVYLAIGFYLGGYFQKYWYNAEADELVAIPEEDDGYIDVGDYTPYTAALEGEWMWVVSRNASPYPSPTGTPGVFRFNVNSGEIEDLDYEVPGENNPYAIMIDNDGNVWVSDAGNWGQSKNRQFAVYDSDGVVSYVPVGFDVRPMRGFMQDEDGTIWATTIDGRVLKGTYNGAWSFEVAIEGLGELTGIGMDAQGYIWVVRYGNNSISRFNPADDLPIDIDETVGVGAGPYAYDNFIVEPQTGCLSVEKIWEGYEDVIGFDEEEMIPDSIDILIKGPSFEAEYPDGKPFTLESASDPAWYLEVCDLEPGNYDVYEDAEDEDWYDLWDIDVDPRPVTVEAGGEPADAKVTITNTYQPGCLEINKQWFYGELYFDDEVPDSITVLIEGPSFDPDGKEVTLEGPDWSYETCYVLIPGEYTVTELDVDGDVWSVVYVVGDVVSAEAGVVYVEPDERATVNINNYYLFKDDTFWAYGADEDEGGDQVIVDDVYFVRHNNKVDGNPSNAWGWTNFINEARTYTWDLWAGAGQNILDNGYKVGTLTVVVTEDDGEFCATVTYNVDAPYVLSEYHLWIGETPLPVVQRGRNTAATAAPGQFPYGDGAVKCGLPEGGFYVAAHGVVRVGFEPATVESVIFSDIDDSGCFGTAVGDEVVITFAKNIYKVDDITATFSNVQWSILSAGVRTDYDITDNVLTFTVNEVFVNPRCIEGEKLISITGLADEYNNPVFLPAGGVDVITQ